MRNIVLLGNNTASNLREFTILPESFQIMVEPGENKLVEIDFMKNDSGIYSTVLLLEDDEFDYFEEDSYENINEDDLSDFLLRCITADLANYANYEYSGDADEDDLYGWPYFDLNVFTERWEERLKYEIHRRMKEDENEDKDDEDK